jgi:preprotein translocase subunit YajC
MLKKKGVIEVQFNWVFVLIVGGIILAFFVTIVMKQKATSEESISITTLTRLDEILTGAGVSANTVEVIQIPAITLTYDCDNLYIGGAPKKTLDRVLFAPKSMSGREIVTWTLDWSVPYKVANFLYVGGEDTKYVFLSNSPSPEFKKIFSDLPANFSKSDKVLEPVAGKFFIKQEDFKQYRFVIDGQTSITDLQSAVNDVSFLSKLGSAVTAVQVDIPNNRLTFYKKNGVIFENKGFATYIDNPMIYAAVFSDDFDNYKCVMAKAVKKMNVVSEIYYEKELAISKDTTLPTTCVGLRGTAAAKTIADSSLSYDTFQASIFTIEAAMTELERSVDTGRRWSCPSIY